MNHDIAHCTGIEGDDYCAECTRKKAHEELQTLVHRGRTVSGMAYQYVSPYDCEDNDHSMYWYIGCGSIHDTTDTIPTRQ